MVPPSGSANSIFSIVVVGADPFPRVVNVWGLRLETCKATEESHVGTLVVAATKSMEYKSAYRSRYGNSSTASETAMLTATYVYVIRHICYALNLRVQRYINFLISREFRFKSGIHYDDSVYHLILRRYVFGFKA